MLDLSLKNIKYTSDRILTKLVLEMSVYVDRHMNVFYSRSSLRYSFLFFNLYFKINMVFLYQLESPHSYLLKKTCINVVFSLYELYNVICGSLIKISIQIFSLLTYLWLITFSRRIWEFFLCLKIFVLDLDEKDCPPQLLEYEV